METNSNAHTTPPRTQAERWAAQQAEESGSAFERWEARQPADQTTEEYMAAMESRMIW